MQKNEPPQSKITTDDIHNARKELDKLVHDIKNGYHTSYLWMTKEDVSDLVNGLSSHTFKPITLTLNPIERLQDVKNWLKTREQKFKEKYLLDRFLSNIANGYHSTYLWLNDEDKGALTLYMRLLLVESFTTSGEPPTPLEKLELIKAWLEKRKIDKAACQEYLRLLEEISDDHNVMYLWMTTKDKEALREGLRALSKSPISKSSDPVEQLADLKEWLKMRKESQFR